MGIEKIRQIQKKKKKQDTEGYILYDSIYVNCPEYAIPQK